MLRVGVLPTPAVAFLTASYGADLGVMLSASHNPMPDNGIKLFAARRAQARRRHRGRDRGRCGRSAPTSARPAPRSGGCATVADAAERYLAHLLAAVPVRLDGLHVVVDCAHGAASAVAPRAVPARRGPGDRDRCRAGRPEHQRRRRFDPPRRPGQGGRARRGADLGIAHDGDADRCLAVDADGQIVDGDQILALCALALREAGQLRDDAVVATVMSNLGFHHAMRDAGIDVITTSVGDRYVLEALARQGI